MQMVIEGEKSELEYVSKELVYNVDKVDWQLIRPSFLFFLNSVVPPSPEHGGPLVAVEVGVGNGLNSRMMLSASSRIFLHMVENCLDVDKNSMVKYTENFKDRTNIVIKNSLDAVKDYPDECFDYVYIDAAHDYDNVYADVSAWFPKVKKGGMLAGHDWGVDSVRSAVSDWVEKNPQRLYGIQYYFNEIPRTPRTEKEFQGLDWWFIK